MITTIKELAELSENHPYYCSESSYYGLGFETKSNSWKEFVESMGGADLDMNLVFRWDVKEKDDTHQEYYMEVFIMHQRKGRFVPFFIETVTDEDVPSILDYLTVRKEHLQLLWEGL